MSNPFIEEISGKKLIFCRVVNIESTVERPSGYVLVCGIVIDPDKRPIPNAAITVYSVKSGAIPERKYVGVTFSDKNGEYGFTLPSNLKVSYELTAYSPLL